MTRESMHAALLWNAHWLTCCTFQNIGGCVERSHGCDELIHLALSAYAQVGGSNLHLAEEREKKMTLLRTTWEDSMKDDQSNRKGQMAWERWFIKNGRTARCTADREIGTFLLRTDLICQSTSPASFLNPLDNTLLMEKWRFSQFFLCFVLFLCSYHFDERLTRTFFLNWKRRPESKALILKEISIDCLIVRIVLHLALSLYLYWYSPPADFYLCTAVFIRQSMLID